MKCAIKGCKNEVVEISGATGRPLCRVHLYGPGTKMQPAPENKMLTPDSNKDELSGLAQLSGVGQDVADALAAGGFKTADSVRAATDEELLDVTGIGEKRLALIREALG